MGGHGPEGACTRCAAAARAQNLVGQLLKQHSPEESLYELLLPHFQLSPNDVACQFTTRYGPAAARRMEATRSS